jgi:glucose dehydrogenase
MNILGWSAVTVAGLGLLALGMYIHRDSHKMSRNFGAALIFCGAVLLATTAFGSWMTGIGAIGGVLALLGLIFCVWVIWRDVAIDKKADKRAAVALFLLPFVFALGLAQVAPTMHTIGSTMQAKFSSPTQQQVGNIQPAGR